MPKSRARFIALNALLARRNVRADEQAIKAGRVVVDGRVIANPAARVRVDASVRVQAESRLRGDVKLSYALEEFGVRMSRHDPVEHRVDSSHVVFTEEGVRLHPVSLRYAWPAELDAMALVAGLQCAHRYGGYDRRPFDASAFHHVSIYQRLAQA